MDTNFYENRKIPSNIESLITDLTTIMGDNAGLLKNRIEISGIKCVFLSFDGMASLAIMTPLVLNPLEKIEIRRATPYELKNHIKSKPISRRNISACLPKNVPKGVPSGIPSGYAA